jgi:RNA polymerase sigma factor (sigma-70 family)
MFPGQPETHTVEQHPRSHSAVASRNGPPVDWTLLVTDIKAGDPVAMEEFYRLFSRGIRFYLCRQLGSQELDDKVHDTLLIVVKAIRRGDLREPERLIGFVRNIVRGQVAAHLDEAAQTRPGYIESSGFTLVDARRDPEQRPMSQENEHRMGSMLGSMSRRDREILTRFYLHGQPEEQICKDMNISETQFRLLKSQAKVRFGGLGKKKLPQKPDLLIF